MLAPLSVVGVRELLVDVGQLAPSLFRRFRRSEPKAELGGYPQAPPLPALESLVQVIEAYV